MGLYQDPAAPRPRPSLVRDLFTLPTKPTLHPLENQATAVLAWLADRSKAFAAELVSLFLGASVEIAHPIGARAWVSLPQPGGVAVFPDLSLDGPAKRFQLLIEVKVGSDFHVYPMPDGSALSQPDYYRYAWAQLPAGSEAEVRAVGTLTRPGGDTPVAPADLKARDVTWAQVRDTLGQMLSDGGARARRRARGGLVPRVAHHADRR